MMVAGITALNAQAVHTGVIAGKIITADNKPAEGVTVVLKEKNRSSGTSIVPAPNSAPEPVRVARRSSSQLCRIATAAAWSIIARWSLDRTPAARSDRCALTVVSRSSASRTGRGATRRASASASSIASWAEGPVRSASVRGNPMTISTASRSLASCANRRTCLPERSRRTVWTGVARMPSGSLHATPMRTLPTSMPSRRPSPGSPSGSPGRSGSRCCAETT